MPHAELRYSNDLEIDAAAVLARIEAVIQAHDAASGACKGRAYRAEVSHHTHVLVTLNLLSKPHRDAAFTKALMDDVEAAVKDMIPQSCYFSLGLEYCGDTYVTNRHEVSA